MKISPASRGFVRALLTIEVTTLAFLLGLALSSCSGAEPVPTPIGPVADAAAVDAPLPIPTFDHKVFDCHQVVVLTWYDGARLGTYLCLSSSVVDASADPPESVGDCMVRQAGTFDPAVVACLARDLGASANAAVLSGRAGPYDAAVASAARDFINSQHLGYR